MYVDIDKEFDRLFMTLRASELQWHVHVLFPCYEAFAWWGVNIGQVWHYVKDAVMEHARSTTEALMLTFMTWLPSEMF